MSGRDAQRGFIYQSIIAMIECLERYDWDEVKLEPDTKLDKVDIQLYRNGVTISAIQVKSSVNQFERFDVKKWHEDLKKDAIGAGEILLYLVGDYFSDACNDYIIQNGDEIRKISFRHLEDICTGKLARFLKKTSFEGDVQLKDLNLIDATLFSEIHRNSTSQERLSRNDFEEAIRSVFAVQINNLLISAFAKNSSFFAKHEFLYRNFVVAIYLTIIGLIPVLRRIHIIKMLSLSDRIIIFGVACFIILIALWNIETDPEVASRVYATITENELLHDTPQELMATIIGSFGEKHFISRSKDELFREFYRFERLSFGGWDKNKINYLSIDFKFQITFYDPTALYIHFFSTRNTAIRMLSLQGFILQEDTIFLSKYVCLKKGKLIVFLKLRRNMFVERIVILNCQDYELKDRIERFIL